MPDIFPCAVHEIDVLHVTWIFWEIKANTMAVDASGLVDASSHVIGYLRSAGHCLSQWKISTSFAILPTKANIDNKHTPWHVNSWRLCGGQSYFIAYAIIFHQSLYSKLAAPWNTCVCLFILVPHRLRHHTHIGNYFVNIFGLKSLLSLNNDVAQMNL